MEDIENLENCTVIFNLYQCITISCHVDMNSSYKSPRR